MTQNLNLNPHLHAASLSLPSGSAGEATHDLDLSFSSVATHAAARVLDLGRALIVGDPFHGHDHHRRLGDGLVLVDGTCAEQECRTYTRFHYYLILAFHATPMLVVWHILIPLAVCMVIKSKIPLNGDERKVFLD